MNSAYFATFSWHSAHLQLMVICIQSLWCKVEEGYRDVSRSGQILVERNCCFGTWASLPDLGLVKRFRFFPVKLFKLGAWMIQDVLKLGILPKSKISENVILVTFAREVDHPKESRFSLFIMVQVFLAQGDFFSPNHYPLVVSLKTPRGLLPRGCRTCSSSSHRK